MNQISHLKHLLTLLLCLVITSSADVTLNVLRTGGGDLTNLNSVLNLLTLGLTLSIDPKPIDYEVGFITVPMEATIGKTGFCNDLQINPGGDIYVTGEFLEGDFQIEGFNESLTAYEITVSLEVLQFACTIPLMVTVEGVFEFVNTVDGFGDLTFRSESAVLTQKIIAYSPDFKNSPPVFAAPGDCDAQPNNLTYKGDNLGSIAGADITDIVIDELEADPSYVFNDVRNELCNLGEDLGQLVASLLVNEQLTNTSSTFYVSNPFIPDDGGSISALDSENYLYEEYPEATEGLINMLDTDNFFVDILLAESSNETAIVNQILELILDPNSEYDIDPVILVAAELLNVPVQPDGSLQNINIVELIFDDGINFEFGVSLVEDAIKIDGSIGSNSILIDIFPPVPEFPNEPAPFILPPFLPYSNHTVLLEGINLAALGIQATINIDLVVENFGVDGNDFLQEPFKLVFDEELLITFGWEGFLASFGILFALNVDFLKATEVGPLIENVLDCVLAIFPLVPAITGATLGHDEILIDLANLKDSIFILIADIIEVILPAFQPVVPRALELLIADTITNVQFFEETTCPLEDPNTDNIETFPFDFSQGILTDIKDIITAENLNNIFSNFDIVDNGLYFVGAPVFDPEDPGAGFEVKVPEINGWTQNITVYMQGFAIEGFLPPYFRDLTLFEVVEDSEYFPQYLHNVINVGRPGDQVGVKVIFNVTVKEPEIDPEVDPALVSPTPPEVFKKQESYLNISWYTDAADLILDFYLRLSQYDVRSMTIQEFINVGCWGSRLDYPGGISLFTIEIKEMETVAVCDDCDNVVMQQWLKNFQDPDTYEDQLFFLNDFLNRFGVLMVKLFDEDRFEQTKETCFLVCDNNDYNFLGNLTEYEVYEYHGEITSLLPFLALFCFAIQTPCLVARFLNKYGPELHKIKKHHINEKINKEFISSARLSADQEIVEKAKALEEAMFKNPLISNRAKILFPLILFTNFILFIIGDTGDAVRINIVGQFFLVPYEAKNFRSLSVISSVIELFKSGGWLLGLLLLTLSILWPYVKLVIMGVCWVLPTKKMSVSTRGKVIEFLDFFGRFSFAEFHFLVFVLVVFQLDANSPRNTFLPDTDLFSLTLELEPLISLFTFCLAVVLSIVVSNVMLVFQHNIEDERRIKQREEDLVGRTDKESDEILALDKEAIRVTSWSFRVDEEDEHNSTHYVYKYKITNTAIGLLAGIVLVAAGCLLAASFTASLRIELYGFFAYLVQFAGDEKTYEISVYGLLYQAIESYSSNYIVYFVGLIFIFTIVIIPVMQTILLMVLLFKPVTLAGARNLTEAHHVISVWCCIDVFIVAITLTVLELPTVAGGLAGNLDFCDDVGEAMFTYFEPMGYVGVEDVKAGCITMKSDVTEGAYIAVLSVFVLNIGNFFVSRMFYSFIADREKVSVKNLSHIRYDTNSIKSYHDRLQRWGMIVIDRNNDEKTQANSQVNPMFQTAEAKDSFFSNLSNASPQKSKRRGKDRGSSFETQKNPLFRENNEEVMLLDKLNKFYDEVDPSKKSRSKAQVRKALKEENGITRLNAYLERKYQRGINLEVEF